MSVALKVFVGLVLGTFLLTVMPVWARRVEKASRGAFFMFHTDDVAPQYIISHAERIPFRTT
ncbi:hypothetical protein [Halodesulfovibrio sp.]|uniref:hypothetical protein n=1 Tax=Halodesulfovibrio sp. TaxID=1912772 RepID=UPI0025C1DC3B|nr:hypothetical protein [Halodesulfovibrio sp.]